MAISGQDRTDQDKRSFPNQGENINSKIRPRVTQRIHNANSSLQVCGTKGWYFAKSTAPLHQLLLLVSKESDLRSTTNGLQSLV